MLRPHGNRGEVLAVSQSDVPGRLEKLKNATARLRDGSLLPVTLESSRPHKDLWVLKFAGVDSISDAERFRAAELTVPLAERAQLPDGEFFRSDLIGCAVIERVSGRVVGSVEGWQQYGGPPLMEVRVDGREVLIPFVPAICQQIDLANRKILVDLPEGLLGL